jgi:hypothetical protein
VRAAGFGDCHEWMMWKHDVYGSSFQLLWPNCEITDTNKAELLQQHEEDFDELDVLLHDAFEDLTISE